MGILPSKMWISESCLTRLLTLVLLAEHISISLGIICFVRGDEAVCCILQADWMCMLANTNDSKPHTSKSLICVPMGLPGVSVVEKTNKLGMHSSNSCRVSWFSPRQSLSFCVSEWLVWDHFPIQISCLENCLYRQPSYLSSHQKRWDPGMVSITTF